MRLFIIVAGLIFAMPFGWTEILLDPTLVCKKTKKLRGKLAEICQYKRNNDTTTTAATTSVVTSVTGVTSATTTTTPTTNTQTTNTLLKEIINGINLGFKECEFQFNNRRWNCTTLRKSMRKILMKDIRETSFVNAITSAGVTYSIARACSTGKLIECSCDKSYSNSKGYKKLNNNNNNKKNNENKNNISIDIIKNLNKRTNTQHDNTLHTSSAAATTTTTSSSATITTNNQKNNRKLNKKLEKNLQELSENNWEWGGCGDNYKYGIRTSKIFLDSKYKKRSDIHTLVKLHNNQAGRLAVRDNMKIDCKCHGLSGSCTIKTCWTKMPTFHEIGSYLKEHFNGAVKVISSNDGNNFIPEEPTVKKPSKYDLVYVEDSPDFCRTNFKTGSLGTTGRECNATSMSVDGCEILCCNRGYYQRTIIQEVNCKCVFKWCCEVSCSTCKEKKEISICR